ncbi:MerR family transcriptional regulator [Staphylococcus lutrae]|uniref:MerR family transcriptional regulator n=1 Tax=Staphylococcus lutrae TaxID=155085 RepID=A0AAC9WJ59_9STAP|nr:MerR family transcriptional regulator [Staphylococcus lutrae]ARJ50658.1 MerR family transcriptional regulator [Staphylococcus lutrae]PNZ39122.1 MerR family transcriptional regulator [Staphylococcus lutrae]
MSQYSTGKLASMFDISKRTLQYYDEKGILKPAWIEDNQYRIYTEHEVEQLNLILIMKSLGLNLKEIRKLMSSQGTLKTVRLILEQKAQATAQEIQTQQAQLKQIKAMQNMILDVSSAPVKNLSDIERMMKKQPQLSHLTRHMVFWGATTTIAHIFGIRSSLKYRTIWPTIAAFSYSGMMSYRLVKYYYEHVAYMCPNCQTIFKPDIQQWIFASHTPKTRQLQCPNCDFKGYCAEVYDEPKATVDPGIINGA